VSDRNIFGGGNAKSLYTPMSELEQEVVARLVESGELQVVIVGWGYVTKPRITFGDLRLSLAFRLTFDRPEVPVPLWYLDMELRTGSGRLLYKERQPTTYGGNPIHAGAGVYFDLVWDIAIKAIDPALVREVLPGAFGLTSRLQDKDTHEFTMTGNMRLTEREKRVLKNLRKNEAQVKQLTAERLKSRK
jgi:hypothetical protein